MASGGYLIKMVGLVMACMLLVATVPYEAEGAVTCGLVASKLAPCVGFLKSGGGVPAGCCAGVKGLLAAASTTPDRKAACGCLKTAAGSIPGINLGNAAALPGKCGVNIPYKISPSTDCSKVV